MFLSHVTSLFSFVTLAVTLTLLLAALRSSPTHALQEVPCVVPEGFTDPQLLYSNEKEPVGGERCKHQGISVQQIVKRCEGRLCCKAKCSCEDTQSLENEGVATCPDDATRTEGVIYNCYTEHREMRYYKWVCCGRYEEDEDGMCVPIVDCASNNGGCAHQCVTGGGRDQCVCNTGYKMVDRVKCEDINECEDASLNNCGIHKCMNTPGGYTCDCQPGYRLAGNTCIDTDECKSGTHTCEGRCINTEGSYTCTCGPGYELQPSGACNEITTEEPTTSPDLTTKRTHPNPQESSSNGGGGGGTPDYVHAIGGVIAALILLVLLLLLFLFIRRRNRQKQNNMALSNIPANTPAFENVMYDMTQGGAAGHDYEELPPALKMKIPDGVDDDDVGQAEALPDKTPLPGAVCAEEGHYDEIPAGKEGCEDLGEEHGRAVNQYDDLPVMKGTANKGFEDDYMPMGGNGYVQDKVQDDENMYQNAALGVPAKNSIA